MQNIINKIRGFKKEEDGTAVIETVIVLPILVMIMTSMIVYFDAFKARSTNLKAAYTISDLISREKLMVGEDFVEGLHGMFDFIVNNDRPTSIRVTMFQFDTEDPDDDTDGSYVFVGSHATGDMLDLDEEGLNDLADRIPIMGHGLTGYLVETRSRYIPGFQNYKKGNGEDYMHIIPAFDINNLIVTTTRFNPPCWEDCLEG